MANDSVGKFKKMHAEAQALIQEEGLETQDDSQISKGRRFVRFWLLVVTSFLRSRCPVRASALAYTTLLALIPLLAVIIGVSTSLLKNQGEKPIQQFIDTVVANIAPQLDLVSKKDEADGVKPEAGANTPAQMQSGRQEVVHKITEYIGNIRSGTLGVTGFVSLILVAILLLSTIEDTFNDIWGVPRGRSWFSRVVLYWSAITLGPMFIFVAVGLTSGPYFEGTKRLLTHMPFIGDIIFGLLPFVLLMIGFSLFYILMPNTRVHWKAAIAGGAVGGVLWQLNNIFNIIYVSKVISYSKIYGSFGMVPVFLIGLYFSWLILLFGAQVAYAFQNQRAYRQGKLAESVNQRSREFVALRLAALISQRFHRGAQPLTVADASNGMAVPSRLASHILEALVKARLLVEVAGAENAYAPARPLEQITVQDILQAMRTSQGYDLPTREDPSRVVVRQELDRVLDAERQAASATTLLDLVNKLPS